MIKIDFTPKLKARTQAIPVPQEDGPYLSKRGTHTMFDANARHQCGVNRDFHLSPTRPSSLSLARALSLSRTSFRSDHDHSMVRGKHNELITGVLRS